MVYLQGKERKLCPSFTQKKQYTLGILFGHDQRKFPIFCGFCNMPMSDKNNKSPHKSCLFSIFPLTLDSPELLGG